MSLFGFRLMDDGGHGHNCFQGHECYLDTSKRGINIRISFLYIVPLSYITFSHHAKEEISSKMILPTCMSVMIKRYFSDGAGLLNT